VRKYKNPSVPELVFAQHASLVCLLRCGGRHITILKTFAGENQVGFLDRERAIQSCRDANLRRHRLQARLKREEPIDKVLRGLTKSS
jgi:hypothetical protein